MTSHTGNKRLLWQYLTTMVIDKIRKMSIKGVKLKSESFFSISPGVLELGRKNLRGGWIPPPSGTGRVNEMCLGICRRSLQTGLNNLYWAVSKIMAVTLYSAD